MKPSRTYKKNSLISFKLIQNYSYEYQSYLESKSDYLLDQIKWWKETDHGVMLYHIESDQTNEVSKLKIRHSGHIPARKNGREQKNCGKNRI